MTASTASAVVTLFRDVVKSTIYSEVEPGSCILFLNIRQVRKSVALRMVALFRERAKKHLEGYNTETSFGYVTPIVVEQSSGKRHVVNEYLISRGRGHTEAKPLMEAKKTWYAVFARA